MFGDGHSSAPARGNWARYFCSKINVFFGLSWSASVDNNQNEVTVAPTIAPTCASQRHNCDALTRRVALVFKFVVQEIGGSKWTI